MSIRFSLKPFLALTAALLLQPALADIDHESWTILLQEHVRSDDGGKSTQVDYAGLAEDRAALRGYLQQLSAIGPAEFEGWSVPDQLAFLINAYNAYTIELVLTEYPDIDSIRDIGSFFSSPWKRAFIPLLGEQRSLDNIEHDLIRGGERYREPRIHFAVNCAAIGCPALRREAYVGDELSQQLDDATGLFLSDRTRNYFERDRIYVSKIFDWYEEDFRRGWLGVNSVGEFLARYADALQLSPEQARRLEQGEMRIRHLSYDWGLNAVRD